MSLTCNGNALGTILDQYWPTNFYPIVVFGTTNLPIAGNHAVRLTVTGKGNPSTNFTLTADKFILLPQ
jgi:hypothetical protein